MSGKEKRPRCGWSLVTQFRAARVLSLHYRCDNLFDSLEVPLAEGACMRPV
ncbi:MAG: hypothetical protein OXI95_06410 [bacterium]|nr:hypothetical protein [bacterium]